MSPTETGPKAFDFLAVDSSGNAATARDVGRGVGWEIRFSRSWKSMNWRMRRRVIDVCFSMGEWAGVYRVW